MGIISRRVLPVCGSLCVFCPEMRTRSRQPVKRYKKLLTDIFPKSQDELPNDRKISKLVEYALKNPLRIPKIADALETRGYKELRSDHSRSVEVVMRTYSKLLSSCRDQMPLFARSILNMIKALFDQVRQDPMRILGSVALVDFLENQTDSTYLRNVDAFLPKLCAMGRETGDETKRMQLRAAGLQALAAMISFMGKYSHIPAEFEDIVAVILDNYDADIADLEVELQERSEPQTNNNNWVKEVLQGEGRGAVSAMKGAIAKLYSHKENARSKDPTKLTSMEAESPKVWSQICVQNLARLAKEATTVRRILDPMFQYFDRSSVNWSPEEGLALPVLREIHFFMDKSGNEKLFLPVVVRHLDHKLLVDQPDLKMNIVEVIGTLARQSKAKSSVVDVGSMTELLRHLRKSIQYTRDTSHASQVQMLEDHKALQTALEESLTEFAKRVGSAGPVLDMMASNLEKLSTNPMISRTTIEAVSVLARCVSFIPDQSYTEQLFPEALFQQLVQAMIHFDAETRLRAHHVLAVLLAPTAKPADELDIMRTVPEVTTMLARTSSVFSTAAALFEKLRSDKYGFSSSFRDREIQRDSSDGDELNRENGEIIEFKKISSVRKNDENGGPLSSPNRLFGFKLTMDRTTEIGLDRSPSRPRRPAKSHKDFEMTAARLSGHQAALLLSALWIQASLPDNLPSNFEAIAHTYMLTLLFSRAKTSSHSTIARAFQLAFSIRSLALDCDNNQLPPSRRRSLFMLGTAMLVFSGRAYSIPQLISSAKAGLTNVVKDPYLDLVEDNRLKVVAAATINLKDYGSAADDHDALKSLSCISLPQSQTSEALADLILQSSTFTTESEEFAADQMLQPFSPDELQGLGQQLYLNSPHHTRLSHGDSLDCMSFNDIIAHTSASFDDDHVSETSAGDPSRFPACFSTPAHVQHAIGVTQLLEAALQTAGQVACVQVPDSPLSYRAMASQCEAFGVGSRRKMFSVLRLEAEQGSMRLTLPDKDWPALISFTDDHPQAQVMQDTRLEGTLELYDSQSTPLLKQVSLNSMSFSPAWLTPAAPEPWQVFRLPPASPYDNFLKAACC